MFNPSDTFSILQGSFSATELSEIRVVVGATFLPYTSSGYTIPTSALTTSPSSGGTVKLLLQCPPFISKSTASSKPFTSAPTIRNDNCWPILLQYYHLHWIPSVFRVFYNCNWT